MKKSNKRIIKNPLTTTIIFCVAVVFIMIILWLHLIEFIGMRQTISNICGSIVAVDLFGFILLCFLFGKKWLKIERAERNKRFEQKVKAGAKVLLMRKRAVTANFLLILSPIALLIFVAFAPTIVRIGNAWAVATFVPLLALLTVLGVIFSFVTPKEYVRYENGKIYLFKKPYSPDQIIKMEKVYNLKTNDPVCAMWFDYRFQLDNGDELYFSKADIVMGFEKKIKKIQELLAK